MGDLKSYFTFHNKCYPIKLFTAHMFSFWTGSYCFCHKHTNMHIHTYRLISSFRVDVCDSLPTQMAKSWPGLDTPYWTP